MVEFKWKDEFSVGIPEMDTTHREFIELVDALLVTARDEFRQKFVELVDHTRTHFHRESELMRVSRFPPTPIHEEEHQRILDIFEKALEEMNRENPAPAQELVRQLPDWFSLHAATMDRALGFHLNQSGVAPVPPETK